MGIIRKTKTITLILELLEPSSKAVLAVNLVEQLKKEVNKTTVYRTLERLESEGLVHSFVGKDGLKWYAKCSDCSTHHHNDVHPHFQCNTCKKVTCLSIDVSIPKVNGYAIETAAVFLTGQCNNCI